jgi:protein-tyrosine kinase
MNIPCQNMEIEQIYTQILGGDTRSIALCSANEGEGVTSVLVALAQRSLLAGYSTLIVDLNLYHPSFKTILPLAPNVNSNDVNLDEKNSGSSSGSSSGTSQNACGNTNHNGSREVSLLNQPLISPQLITVINTGLIMTGIIAPNGREHTIKLRQPGVLERCIEEWQTQYDIVIIDTPPINRINAQNIPAQGIAMACDATLLVVLAGKTTEEMVSSAIHKLKSADVNLVGCIYNDRYNSSLKNELLRQLQRLEGRFKWLLNPIKKFIKNNEILKLEI